MITYGDPGYQTNISGLLAQLTAALEKCQPQNEVDDLRYLLILAGQAEQAVYDGVPGDVSLNEEELNEWLETFSRLTALAAQAFYKFWQKLPQTTLPLSLPASDIDELNLLKDLLFSLQQRPPVAGSLTVKIPEGYAFYALYPEQYCFAARQWLADHEQLQRDSVAVIGLRSIGTSLAALVCAVLEEAGWPAHSFTVRPGGHPYRRELKLEPVLLKKATTAIVVDEGPGQSGSSMAAVAFALEQQGLPLDRITFMPGHPGDPGSAASEEVQTCWSIVPRYVVPIPPSPLGVAGRTLPDLLSEQAGLILDSAHTQKQTGEERSAQKQSLWVENIGWGQWRNKVFANVEEWPPVYTSFELPKYLVSTSEGPALVMKFYGLCAFSAEGGSAAAMAHTRLNERAKAGFGPASPGYTQGFVACEWVNGSPLTSKDVDDTVLEHLGRYIAAVAGPPLKPAESGPALERLQEMLYWNTWEILGEDAARTSRNLAVKTETKNLEIDRCYGDGHLAPHEWLRTPEGTLVKVNGAGLATDHTCVGSQPVYWDLAGAIIEWQLSLNDRNCLVARYEKFSGGVVQPPVLTFYCAAYTAFKAGKAHLCALQTGDETERARLWSEFETLKSGLATWLSL